MFGYFHAYKRHVKHLAFFVSARRNLLQYCIVLLVSRDGMDIEVVWPLDFNQTIEFALNDLRKDVGWAEYSKGVAWVLQQTDYSLRGFESVVVGNVPIGAGLSSSAAWELAAARAFSVASDFP